MDEQNRRLLKGDAATWGLTESDALVGSWLLARVIVARGLMRDLDGEPVTLAHGLELVLDGDQETITVTQGLRDLGTRHLALERLLLQLATSEEWESLRPIVTHLHEEGPWTWTEPPT